MDWKVVALAFIAFTMLMSSVDAQLAKTEISDGEINGLKVISNTDYCGGDIICRTVYEDCGDVKSLDSYSVDLRTVSTSKSKSYDNAKDHIDNLRVYEDDRSLCKKIIVEGYKSPFTNVDNLLCKDDVCDTRFAWWNTTYECQIPVTVSGTASKTALIAINSSSYSVFTANLSNTGDNIAIVDNDNTTTHSYTPVYINKTGTNLFLFNVTGQTQLWIYGCNNSVVADYTNYGIPLYWNPWTNLTGWTDKDIGTGDSFANGGYLNQNATFSPDSYAWVNKTGTTTYHWSNLTDVSLLYEFEVLDRGSDSGDWELTIDVADADFDINTPVGFHIRCDSKSQAASDYLACGLNSGASWSMTSMASSAVPLESPNFILLSILPTSNTVTAQYMDSDYLPQGTKYTSTAYTSDVINSVTDISVRDVTSTSTVKARQNFFMVYDNTSIGFTLGAISSFVPAFDYTYSTSAPASGQNFSETETVRFQASVTFNSTLYMGDDAVPTPELKMYYNGTKVTTGYTHTQTSGSGTKTMISYVDYKLPQVPTDIATASIVWDINFTYAGNFSTLNVTTTPYSINVYKVKINSTTGLETIHFNIYDELNSSLISTNTTTNLHSDWNVTKDGTYYRSYYFMDTATNNYSMYIIPNWANYTTIGSMEYWATGYTPRTWYIDNLNISNTSQTINLYLLAEANSTAVKIIVKDADYNNVPGVTIEIRKIALGVGNDTLIQTTKTDSEGKALVYLYANFVKYSFTLYQDGTQVNFYDDMTIVDEGISPIEQILFVGNTIDEGYLVRQGASGSCVFDSGTNITTCTATDTSGYVSQWCVRVTELEMLSTTVVNNTCLTSSSAVLTHYFGATPTGTYTVGLYAVVGSGNIVFDSQQINFKTGAVYGDYGLFIGFFVILTTVIIGLFAPPLAPLFAVAGIGFGWALQLFNITISSIIGLVFAAILIAIRGKGK